VSDAIQQTQPQNTGPQIDIPENVLKDIISWLTSEIQQTKAERQNLEDNVVEWERLYEARPNVARKSIPWDGASNLVVPVVGTAVDAVFARIIEAVFGSQKVWAATALSPQWAQIDDPLERWLNWCAAHVLNMPKVCQRWFMGLVKTGTGVAKLEWVDRKRNVTYRDASGAILKEQITTHSGPELNPIPLPDFIYSNDAIHTQDLQTCQWVAERQLYTSKLLKEMEASKIFKDVEKLTGKERSTLTPLEQEAQRNTGIEVMTPNDFEIWEVWGSFDVDGDGIPEEVVINFHLETRTVLRAVFNFYRHQERPYHLIRFMPRDNSLLGLGIAQMLAPIQEEISAIHNQRLDNATLSNSNVFKARRNSIAAVSPLDIYPGAIIKVDEPDDFQEIRMGQQHATLLPEELNSNAIGEKRTGVSDYTVGRESAAIGSNATATSTLALIQEGNKRFKLTISEIRRALTDIAHQVIMLYQQFAVDRKVMYELFSPEDQQWIEKFLDLPEDISRAGVVIDTPAISEATNKDADRQAYLGLMGLMKQFYDGLVQALSLTINPSSPPPFQALGKQAAEAAVKMWKKVLGAFDIVDTDSFAPDINAILSGMASPNLMGGNPNGGTEGSPTGQGPQSPMDILGGLNNQDVGQSGAETMRSGTIGTTDTGFPGGNPSARLNTQSP
jgi:hypothetical protein